MEQTTPLVIEPGWTRARAISLAVAILTALYGVTMVGFAWYSSMPGSCGNEFGCTGGRDATPLTGIAVGTIMTSFAAMWILAVLRRVRGTEAAPAGTETA